MPRRNQTVRPENDSIEGQTKQAYADATHAIVAQEDDKQRHQQTDTAAHTNGDTLPAPKEAKDAKFYRLAIKRVPAAIKRIRQVANLANKNQYECTDEHAAKIIDALEAELRALKHAFSGTKAPVEAWTL